MSNDPYQPLFELAGVGLAQIDPVSFRYLRVNRRLCQITGFEEGELLGMTPIDITHPEDWLSDRPAFESLLRGESSEHVVEKRYVRKDGRATWVTVTLNPVRDPADGRLVELVSVVQDVDDRVRAESALRKRNEALTLVSETATRLLMAVRPVEEVPGVVGRLAGLLDFELYEAHRYDPVGRRLHLMAWCENFEAERGEIEVIELGRYTCGTVARTGRAMVLEDVQGSAEPAAERVRALGVRAWACYPMLAGGRLMGTMAVGTRARATFEPSELGLIRTTCDQVAMALERRRLTEELEQRAGELTNANRAKDQFLAELSHELRTPLTPVLLAASALEGDATLPRLTREELTTIRQNVEIEARLIDDLLDLTRVSHGKLSLDLGSVDVHGVIQHAVRTVGADAAAKSVIVTSDLGAGRRHVRGDAARVQQILWNLLRNAIKFTPEGGTVTIRTENEGAGGLRVDVIDTGVGIEAEVLPKLFEAYEQGSPSVTRRFGGLGLGLAISRALALAHSGTLTASSAGAGRGSTFTLRLPALAAGEAGAASGDGSAARPGRAAGLVGAGHGGRMRILLVEDHAATASTLARLLRKMGHEVAVAAGVARAMELVSAAEGEGFELMISDIALPDGSGLELVREVRRVRPGVRAIALSGHGTDADIRRSIEAGFWRHLTKPINIEQLKELTNGG